MWGHHLDDMNRTLGNLVLDVADGDPVPLIRRPTPVCMQARPGGEGRRK